MRTLHAHRRTHRRPSRLQFLKSIFHDTSGNDGMLAAWLASDERDAEIEAKEATRELMKLVLFEARPAAS